MGHDWKTIPVSYTLKLFFSLYYSDLFAVQKIIGVSKISQNSSEASWKRWERVTSRWKESWSDYGCRSKKTSGETVSLRGGHMNKWEMSTGINVNWPQKYM